MRFDDICHVRSLLSIFVVKMEPRQIRSLDSMNAVDKDRQREEMEENKATITKLNECYNIARLLGEYTRQVTRMACRICVVQPFKYNSWDRMEHIDINRLFKSHIHLLLVHHDSLYISNIDSAA